MAPRWCRWLRHLLIYAGNQIGLSAFPQFIPLEETGRRGRGRWSKTGSSKVPFFGGSADCGIGSRSFLGPWEPFGEVFGILHDPLRKKQAFGPAPHRLAERFFAVREKRGHLQTSTGFGSARHFQLHADGTKVTAWTASFCVDRSLPVRESDICEDGKVTCQTDSFWPCQRSQVLKDEECPTDRDWEILGVRRWAGGFLGGRTKMFWGIDVWGDGPQTRDPRLY